MFRSKKALSLLTAAALLPLLGACSFRVFSDTGTDISAERDITDYLDLNVLENTPPEEKAADTYTVTRGIFTVPGLESTYNRDYYTACPVRANVEYGSMTYVSTEVSNYETVTKGDVLALIEIRTDPVDLLQARLQLQRLTERYAEETRSFEEEYEKERDALKLIWNPYENKVRTIQLERRVLEWQNTCRSYEKQIAHKQREVSQLEACSESPVRAVTADRDGLVILPSSLPRTGDTVENGRLICSILPLDELIFSASNNQYQTYRYGMDFTWTVNVRGGQPLEMTGSVVTGTEGDLYGNLREDKIYFLLQPEAESDLSDTETQLSSNIRDAKIHGDQGTMENVLLVPTQAVTVENGIPYVTVVKQDGSFLKKGFLAGGSNANYYWVLDGLEEGAVILAEP
ncbi:MAG: hypothetical protein NC541_12710 [bacterium]|nr:hypothetical protein [bacterium]